MGIPPQGTPPSLNVLQSKGSVICLSVLLELAGVRQDNSADEPALQVREKIREGVWLQAQECGSHV